MVRKVLFVVVLVMFFFVSAGVDGTPPSKPTVQQLHAR